VGFVFEVDPVAEGEADCEIDSWDDEKEESEEGDEGGDYVEDDDVDDESGAEGGYEIGGFHWGSVDSRNLNGCVDETGRHGNKNRNEHNVGNNPDGIVSIKR